MECTSEFQELASHNPFIQGLVDQGFHADFINGYFILYGLPYLDKDGALKYGDWISQVNRGEAWELYPPTSHQAWFHGGVPHDQQGIELKLGRRDEKVTVSHGFVTDYSYSFKLLDAAGNMRQYSSFEEKVRTYLEAIISPAMSAYPDATPLAAIKIRATEQGTPLQIPDMLSAHYNMNDVSFLLRGKKIAIIGLGGTGSYILDFVARTHLDQIVLFDDDRVFLHTIFRVPGFIHRAIGMTKVEALAQHYGKNWHSGIVPVPERITAENIGRLREFDFVFVSVDDGPSRLLIVDWLSSNEVPFVDCGMGLNRSLSGLNGAVRITGVDRSAFEQTVSTPYLPTANAEAGEYRRQAQIAEFNALNAALAVLRFKQHFKLYERVEEAVGYIFESASFELDAKARLQ